MTQQKTAGIGSALFVAAVAMLVTGPLANVAAQEMDDRWLAWMGCWQPVRTSTSADAPESLLCFQPSAGEAGVEMISVEDGEIVSREVVRADGQPRESSLEGCNGSRRAAFASRPGRVFMEVDHMCDGGVERGSSGMFAMISPNAWIDARVVTVGDQKLTWVTRYRLATQSEAEAVGLGEIAADRSLAVRSMRLAASGRYSVEDVIEAAGYVDSEAIEAWIVEHESPIEVDADRLIQLADGGVSGEVIDMMIARSFPDRFALSNEANDENRPGLGYGGYYDPFFGGYSRWGYPYSRYGFGYSPLYGYGGYGYGGYGYGYGYGYGPVIIRTDNDSGGRVISGRGYSSGRRSGGVSGSIGSSRGTSSIGRSSGSSSGRSTGRTARRRGGGGL
ncbi:hypothetical protein [Candidatus Palauibacter sp.]|uniref:hypothetical protein n=1 Tax=Candidatus Palauibacter sp. TaxID=3101350 RepID=UPI003B5CA463